MAFMIHVHLFPPKISSIRHYRSPPERQQCCRHPSGHVQIRVVQPLLLPFSPLSSFYFFFLQKNERLNFPFNFFLCCTTAPGEFTLIFLPATFFVLHGFFFFFFFFFFFVFFFFFFFIFSPFCVFGAKISVGILYQCQPNDSNVPCCLASDPGHFC
jgi:hypothetical protein